MDADQVDRADERGGLLERQAPLAEQAYFALREQVATGELAPGQRLTERSLALNLGVSPTPVREALRRLEQEGLVERSSLRALSVVAHSDQALRELLFAEVVLRAAEARFAAQKITKEHLIVLDEIVDEIHRSLGTASDDDLLALGRQFDLIVAEAASSPGVHRLVESTSVIGRDRRIRAIAAMRGRASDIGRQHFQAHRDLVRAFRDSDSDQAELIMRRHLLSSLDLLLSSDATSP
jgi:DNA-binding GntR family transcriptional regulator